jgi:hypothetical protein
MSLRHAHRITRFVLVWFALSIGVAIASPLVKPQGMQLICSATGTLKIIASSDDGGTSSTTLAGHTLDCPLCAGVAAPPPLAAVAFSSTPALHYALPQPGAVRHTPIGGAALPARGPPSQS